MRIQELRLLAYGKFTDHALAFPGGERDFHVIVGPNEAGKSTLRRAVTELLFGMERQSPLGFKHPQSDLRLAAVLEAASGQLPFMRTKQQKSLRSLAGEVLPEGYLEPALGALTEEAFEQLHCLDHERLVRGGQGIVDPRNSVSQILFQAVSGLDTFAAVREALGERASALFATRGKHHEYARAAERYAAAQKSLKELQVRTRDWVQASEQLGKAEAELEQQRRHRAELEQQRSAWERARRLGPVVDRLARLNQELRALGQTIPFPPGAKASLDSGISDLHAAAGIAQTREKDVQTRQQEFEAIVVDQAVLDRAAEIERLAQLCGLYASHPRDLELRLGEVRQWLADVLARSSEFGWGGSEEEVRRLLPPAQVLRAIEGLLKERGALVEAERGAGEILEERRAAAVELQERLAAAPDTGVDPQLAQALSQALPHRNSESRQKSLLQAAGAADAELARALTALGRPDLTEASLRAMQLPSLERVSALRADRQDIANQGELARARMEEAREAAAVLALQVSQFERSHKVVTAGEVTAARRARDEQWGAIKSGALGLAEGAAQVDTAIRLADELVDARTLSETDGVTLQGLRDQLESARDAQHRHATTLQDKGQELREFDVRWAQAAAKMGLAGMELDDLPEWLARRDTALAAALNLAGRKHEYGQEREAAAQARSELAAAMAAAGLAPGASSGLAALCLSAEEHIKALDRARAHRESLQQQLRDAQSALRLARQARESRSAALQAWNSSWEQALHKANLGGSAGEVAAVEAAVQAAGAIRQRLEKIDAHRSERIDAMRADLELLAGTARALAQALAPEMHQSAPQELSRVLSARLEQAKRQSNRKLQAQEFVDQARRQLSQARSAVEQARHGLAPLLLIAGVDDPLLALPLVETAHRKTELESAIRETMEALEQDSDGLTLEQVEAEVQRHPAAEAPGRLQAIKDSLDDSDRQLTQLVQAQVGARQNFGAIDGGDSAAVAEAQRHEALAEMAEAGEEYLQLATASSLLKWAVDKYRDRKQGPLLHRASAVFSNLTRGSFGKLRIDYDQNPPALLAYRPGGQAVKVAGLSDGTRDQLFLALRIAALELQTEQSTPVPFVADDLFINFDDQRSRAGLQALYDLSAKTQVLFLSHQEHLIPVVRELFGSVNVIELRGEELPVP